MCGFVGILSNNSINENYLEKSNEHLICRGPDNKTILNSNLPELFDVNIDLNLSAIFNRLSIIDLTDSANQPMISKEYGTMVLFNGEIYNHKELRTALESKGVKFYSNHSDSEVVLNGLSVEGISFINKLIGQFSIFFLDSKKIKCYLIRDRLGQKPLFYYLDNKSLKFSSNLKSLYHNQNSTIDEGNVLKYLSFGVVPSPGTIFKNIFKVNPASYIEVNLDTFNYIEKKYWNIENYVNKNKFSKEDFFDKFSQSVDYRLISDVPIANFLSGGLDSSSIVKNMFDNGKTDINTFTVEVENEKYDESKWANKVVEKYSTNHYSEIISSKIENDLVIESLHALDEPYSDPSTIPSYLISKAISSRYKVAISGDGGDELLGGYLRTFQMMHSQKIPDYIATTLYGIYPKSFGTGQKILSKSNNFKNAYSSYFEDGKLLNLLNLKINYKNDEFYQQSYDKYKNLILSDYKLYLPEMMMLKVDRTSMANSVEVRSPFVDHKLIEYILSVDSEHFVSNSPKAILKQYLSQDFENEFLNRNKQGFVFDLENWVYNNLSVVSEEINKGNIVNNLNSNIISSLKQRKSRINALRIWRLFVIENYLSDLK